jgi:hypothetical protein
MNEVNRYCRDLAVYLHAVLLRNEREFAWNGNLNVSVIKEKFNMT